MLIKARSFLGGRVPVPGIIILVLPCLSLALSGCGAAIVVAILVGQDLSRQTGSASANSPPVVSGVTVESARASPATVSFVLTDPEGDPVDVEVGYALAKSRRAGAASGRIARLEQLATSQRGTRHAVAWHFEKELGGGLTPDLTVSVNLASGEATLLPEQSVGNDAPEIEVRCPSDEEFVGIAKIDLVVKDSSDDLVSIRGEYLDPENLQEGWQPATPAGATIVGVEAPREGQEINFFWDVKKDLGTVRREVVLRFTAQDGLLEGSMDCPRVRVDNNLDPIARILVKELERNPDSRRGIPIPFEVQDADGHLVQVVFQWSPESEPFPELPESPQEVRAILANPIERRRYRIAAERPAAYEGLLSTLDIESDPEGRKVRLPELASTASPLLHGGMVGREIEVLRISQFPKPVERGWGLQQPVAALPIGDGITALVLDRQEAPGFRLRALDLGDGEVVRSIASSNDGDPSAMALERGGVSVLIALDQAGTWKILRVHLGDGTIDSLFSSAPPLESGPVRGLAVLGRDTALVTVGSSLVRVETTDGGSARAGLVLSGLKSPWGIAVDARSSNRVYLAEKDWEGPGSKGRVISLDLNTLERRTVASKGVERPEALAFERGGTRLLAVCDPDGDGVRDLRGLDLEGMKSDAFRLADALPGSVGSLATGPDLLRVLALTGQNDLAVGGGIEARRSITDFEMSTKEATVDRPYRPRLKSFRRWRIRDRLRPIQTTPRGARGVFVWDSEDADPGGDIVLRATPMDSEVGLPGESEVPHRVKVITVERPLTLGSTASTPLPQALAAADLNGDGRPDLASAGEKGLACFFQSASGSFAAEPDLSIGVPGGVRAVEAADLDGDGLEDLVLADGTGLRLHFQKSLEALGQAPDAVLSGLKTPRAVAACDLDGDGDLDLVSANSSGNDLKVFIQRGTGTRGFEARETLRPGDPGVPTEPGSLAVADLDGDGDLDIASANEAASNLTLFFQDAGEFSVEPSLTLGTSPITRSPESLAAADLNGDGRQDLVSANQLSGNLTVFFQKNPKNQSGFSTSPDLILGGLSGPRSLAAQDLNGDGAPDLVSANVDGNDLRAFFQKNLGVFGPAPDLIIPGLQANQRPVSVLAENLDGDGSPELATANAFSGTITVSSLSRSKAGQFAIEPDLVLGGPQITRNPVSLAAGDLDGDGDLDLAVANQGAVDVTVFLQRSPGAFEAEQNLKLRGNGHFAWVLTLDLDGDGKLEIVGRGSSDNVLEVFFQVAPGLFGPKPGLQVSPVAGSGSILNADLDGNGFQDIAVVNIDWLSVFFQEKPRAFSLLDTKLKPPGNAGPWFLAAGDFDGDGRLDLACPNVGGSPVTIFLQKERGKFPHDPDLVLGAPSPGDLPSIAAGDLDRDGGLDLIIGGQSTLALYFQKGPPRLYANDPELILEPSKDAVPISIASGDLDGDGDEDLVSANRSANSMTVFLQGDPGSFSKLPDLTLEDLPGSTQVLAIDLDGDGDPDLVSANFNGNNLAVFYGSHE